MSPSATDAPQAITAYQWMHDDDLDTFPVISDGGDANVTMHTTPFPVHSPHARWPKIPVSTSLTVPTTRSSKNSKNSSGSELHSHGYASTSPPSIPRVCRFPSRQGLTSRAAGVTSGRVCETLKGLPRQLILDAQGMSYYGLRINDGIVQDRTGVARPLGEFSTCAVFGLDLVFPSLANRSLQVGSDTIPMDLKI